MKLDKRKRDLKALSDEYNSLLMLSEAFGATVSFEGEVMKDVISEHPKYVHYLRGGEIETEDGRRINPRLHIAVETAVQCQLAQGRPPEARRAYLALLDERVDPHEARHAVGYVFLETVWLVLSNELTSDPAKYYCEELRNMERQKLKHRFFRTER
jgi:hypothetical protein